MENSVRVIADPRKFSEYIFKENADHGKDVIFKSPGTHNRIRMISRKFTGARERTQTPKGIRKICIFLAQNVFKIKRNYLKFTEIKTMGLPQRKLFTLDEYLFLEEGSPTKNELVDGEIYAMAGAKKNHVRITGNILYNLMRHLMNSPCDVYSTDMKLKAGYDCYYPDVFVTCEPEDDDLVLEKAVLVVEVLSDSTENFDRGIKMRNYFQIPTLQEYLLVSQKKTEVWIYRRVGKKWEPEILRNGDDDLELTSVGLTVPVRNFYAKVFK